jgi:hypothetical protein
MMKGFLDENILLLVHFRKTPAISYGVSQPDVFCGRMKE